MTTEEDSTLRVLPLGGLGEIGLNMMALAFGDQALIIDSGIMFPDESMPGVDLVIPDLNALMDLQWNILGIVLTHGHEDHIGAIPYVLKSISAPVYATAFTMGLLEHKLEEFRLLESTDRYVISTEHILNLGPFQIDPFSVCHSVPDAVGLIITTPKGVIIHSGDFKLDPTPIDGEQTDLDKVSRYAADGVLALFSDSTNVERAGSTDSERSVRPGLSELFRDAPGRLFVATFSSSLHRVQQILNIAEEFGRKVALVGRSMESNAGIASELGYLDIPPGILVKVRDIEHLPDSEIVVLSTGSQGEPMSALSLVALDRHKFIKLKSTDTVVFSSRFIPGNERAINSMINEFCRRGAWVVYEKVAHVHVSGHGAQEELRTLLRLVRPEFFMPVHGEYRHLQRHAYIAIEEGVARENVLVAENGDLVEFNGSGAAITDHLDTGRVFVDGKGVGDVHNDVLRERRIISEKGLVTVVVLVDKETGKPVNGPELRSLGVTLSEVEPELMEAVGRAVETRLGELNPRSESEWNAAREQIRLAVRRYINRTLGRKPQVHSIVLKV